MTAREPAQEQGLSTRERIQEVALELFGEQGYDKTSLREIAERLEVTKAALYYHFKSKEAILESVLEDYLAEVEELLAWAAERPRDNATKREAIERYADIVARRMKAMRFLQQGASAVKDSESGQRFRAMMKRVHHIFRDDDAPVNDQIRAIAAVVSIHIGVLSFGVPDSPFADSGKEYDPAEVRKAVIEVAGSLVAADES